MKHDKEITTKDKLIVAIIMITLFTIMFLSSCSTIFRQQPVYQYTYKCIEGNLQDTIFYSRVMYLPGDTIIEIPSRNTIVITDIKLYEVKRPKF